MRLRRRAEPAQPELDDDFTGTVAELWLVLESNLTLCRRLTEQREVTPLSGEQRREALQGARQLAFIDRVITDTLMYTDVEPGDFLPSGVHGMTARLIYALIGLAETDPEPEQILSPEELATLPARYEIEDWRERFRSAEATYHPEQS